MFAQSLARSFQIHSGPVALGIGTRSVSWDKFGKVVPSIAKGLNMLGCKPGSRIAVLAGNSPEHLEMMYAISWAGCILVPLNNRLSTAELSVILADSESVALASDSKHYTVVKELLEKVDLSPTTIGLDENAYGEYKLSDLASKESSGAWLGTKSDIGALYYTGGTTGQPKGVMISNHSLLIQTLNIIQDLNINSKTRFLHAPPLFHLAGAGVAHACTFAGATQMFLPEYNPVTYLKEIARSQATLISLVPTMISDIFDQEDVNSFFQTVDTIVYGAAPITEQLLMKVLSKCPDVNLIQIYGQTECSGPCLILPPDRHVISGPLAGKLGSAGRANLTSEVRIADESGVELDRGIPGEILIRGPSTMSGYWKQKTLTDETLENGWLHTGDIGIMDSDGFVTVVDRKKDMIVTGGENVFSSEVENVLANYPGVNYCAVIGVPDEKWGERVHAVVGITEGTNMELESVRSFCKKSIASYKCPQSLDCITDPLPISGVGKVRKDILREKYRKGNLK